MILADVRDYLRAHQRATLGDIALHFDVPHAAMRGMVEQFVAKGRVRRLSFDATCNVSCPIACDDTAMTIYEWVGRVGEQPARAERGEPRGAEPARRSGFRALQTLTGSVGGGCCRR